MAKNSRHIEPDRRTAGKFEMNCALFEADRQQRQYPAVVAAAEPAVGYRRHLAQCDAHGPFVELPAVSKSPDVSSRYSAIRAIMARAESFTDDGDWPSAQLIEESAFEFEAGVFDQMYRP